LPTNASIMFIRAPVLSSALFRNVHL
jgi:hypothetical protein